MPLAAVSCRDLRTGYLWDTQSDRHDDRIPREYARKREEVLRDNMSGIPDRPLSHLDILNSYKINIILLYLPKPYYSKSY